MDKILTAPILWGAAVYGILDGSVLSRLSWVDRSESPIGFWAIVTFKFLFGLFLFCWGIRDAFR
jgi:hypothetical protein